VDLGGLGKMLLAAGLVLVLVGGALVLGGKWPGAGDWFGWLGRLPGDILVKRDNFTFYFPLGTSLVLSLVLSVILYLLTR
jgi:hypothetical protein